MIMLFAAQLIHADRATTDVVDERENQSSENIAGSDFNLSLYQSRKELRSNHLNVDIAHQRHLNVEHLLSLNEILIDRINNNQENKIDAEDPTPIKFSQRIRGQELSNLRNQRAISVRESIDRIVDADAMQRDRMMAGRLELIQASFTLERDADQDIDPQDHNRPRRIVIREQRSDRAEFISSFKKASREERRMILSRRVTIHNGLE